MKLLLEMYCDTCTMETVHTAQYIIGTHIECKECGEQAQYDQQTRRDFTKLLRKLLGMENL